MARMSPYIILVFFIVLSFVKCLGVENMPSHVNIEEIMDYALMWVKHIGLDYGIRAWW